MLSAYACSPIRGSEPGNGWVWAFTLAEKGYNVWCLTNVEDKDAVMLEHKKINLPNLKFIFVSLPFGMDKYLLDVSSKKIYLHYRLWQKKILTVAKELHSKIHFDIIHHVTFGSLQQASHLWKLNGAKFILGPVGGGQKALKEFKSYFGSSWKIEIARNMISEYLLKFSSNLKNMIKNADHILAANEDTKEMIIKRGYCGPEKIHLVLDNAVPLSMQNLPYPERPAHTKLNLIWVGRMLPRKGLKLLIHAVSLLPDEIDYSFTIVGGGEQFPLLKDWIKEFNLNSDRLHIVGQIPFAEVSEHYKKSDVFLFCSLRDSCGAQISEAMAFGLPVIALNIHGSALAVPDDCGIKINPTTIESTAAAISNAIIQFSRNKEYLRTCSINAFNYAKKNTWRNKIDSVTSAFY